jgi:nitroreductase
MMQEATAMTRFLRDLRQVRQYLPDAIPDEALADILEVARWSGSAKNVQPWHFIVIRDRGTLQQLSQLGNYTSFIKDAPLAIAVVLDGKNPRTEWFDEGRVEERMMLAAKAHGIGSGTAWYAEGVVNELLGVPEGYVVRSVVGFGYPADRAQGVRSVQGGRKPLDELVRYERFDAGQ